MFFLRQWNSDLTNIISVSSKTEAGPGHRITVITRKHECDSGILSLKIFLISSAAFSVFFSVEISNQKQELTQETGDC